MCVKRLVKEYQDLIESITPPVTNAEAKVLADSFGPDHCFELEWTLIRLIETAPNWPPREWLVNSSNQWIALLKQRIKNADRHVNE
jgi:hypothetical protein